MVKYGAILIFTFLCLIRLSVQGQPSNCVKSTEGKEFWFGFMENRISSNPLYPPNYLEVTITSRFTCQYSIMVGKSVVAVASGTLQPNIPVKIQVNRLLAEPYGSENIEEKAIHLVSDKPLNLYAMNWGYNSSDAAVIFPVDALGNEYFAMCYEPHVYEQPNGQPWNGKNSEFVVVASSDQTQVTITPSVVTDKLKPAKVPFTIILNKGELYQVQSMNHPNLPGQGDLTGSFIKSDKPVALYSGSWATTIPKSSSYAWDHLYEQIPPLRTWGRKFVSVPLLSRAKDTYRILASVDNTTIRIGDKPTVILNKGEFHEFMLNANEPALIESDYPVLLAQYSNSNDVDRPASIPQGGPWDGDPSMLIISPVDQTREQVTFVAYNTPEITQNFYVNIVTGDNSVDQILLDGQPIAFQVLPNSGYSYAQVKIAQGNHNLKSTEAGKGFIAYVYGFGGVESYGYSVGFNLSTQLDLGGDIHFVKDTMVLCSGQSKILDAGSHFSSFLWNTGETTQKISVSTKGYYEVTATTSDGCVLTDGIHALESNPIVRLGNDTTLCNPGSLLLDAGNFSSFLWSTQDTTKTIQANSPGLYRVLIRNIYNCSARDTIEVSFTDIPVLTVNKIDSVVCGSKTTTVDIVANKGNYTLSSSDPTVKIQGLTAIVPDYGIYPFTFVAKDQYSCQADTSFTVRFRKNSVVAIQIDSTCAGYSLDARYQGTAVLDKTQFTWIFAGDTIAEGIAKDQISIQLGSNGMKDELSLQIAEEGCQSQKVVMQIDEMPDLNFTPSDTVVCLSGEIKFKATNSKNVIDYAWSWGDGVVEHLSANAVHTYTKEGHYDVQLTARTDKNCTNTIKKEHLLYVATIPSVGFSINENQCLEQGIHPLSYVGSANAKDHFHWDLSSFLPGEVIQDPGDSMGPLRFDLKSQPSANVSLQVISKFGCESEKKSVLLKRKPLFSLLTGESKGCTPLQVEMVAKSGDAVDQIDYRWSFGDGITEDGNNLLHTYIKPDQQYNLVLLASSATTGCSDSLSKLNFVTVYPTPEAAFSMDQDMLFIENPTVTFQNESQGADHFMWNFGDGTTSVEKDPVHQFKVVGYLTVLLEALNSIGCSDTVSGKVSIALQKLYTPNAFSPNAVNEIDREFKLFSSGVMEKGYHLKIMSRWNDVIFECKNEIRGWNGELSNGMMAPPGNYIWILEFTDILGKAHRQMGTVMVVY